MPEQLEYLIGPKYIHFSWDEAVTNTAVTKLRDENRAGPFEEELGQIGTIRVTREERCFAQCLFILGDGSCSYKIMPKANLP